ncbi:MAG: hypothetical protein K6E54_09605, partial [Bacteroidaceae bacterium]|nr:hypothetical protein [Bacteroidaceae bacterium]
YKTPHIAVLVVGLINFILIATGSIDYIASVSLISLAVCYMIGCLAYLGLKKHYPEMKRPYKAPLGKIGCYVTIILYCFMLVFADVSALVTAVVLSVACVIFYYIYTIKHKNVIPTLEDEIGEVEEPTVEQKAAMDREYAIWKWGTIIVTIVSLAIYLIPTLL